MPISPRSRSELSLPFNRSSPADPRVYQFLGCPKVDHRLGRHRSRRFPCLRNDCRNLARPKAAAALISTERRSLSDPQIEPVVAQSAIKRVCATVVINHIIYGICAEIVRHSTARECVDPAKGVSDHRLIVVVPPGIYRLDNGDHRDIAPRSSRASGRIPPSAHSWTWRRVGDASGYVADNTPLEISRGLTR